MLGAIWAALAVVELCLVVSELARRLRETETLRRFERDYLVALAEVRLELRGDHE